MRSPQGESGGQEAALPSSVRGCGADGQAAAPGSEGGSGPTETDGVRSAPAFARLRLVRAPNLAFPVVSAFRGAARLVGLRDLCVGSPLVVLCMVRLGRLRVLTLLEILGILRIRHGELRLNW